MHPYTLLWDPLILVVFCHMPFYPQTLLTKVDKSILQLNSFSLPFLQPSHYNLSLHHQLVFPHESCVPRTASTLSIPLCPCPANADELSGKISIFCLHLTRPPRHNQLHYLFNLFYTVYTMLRQSAGVLLRPSIRLAPIASGSRTITTTYPLLRQADRRKPRPTSVSTILTNSTAGSCSSSKG
jgi:hypothetical protein